MLCIEKISKYFKIKSLNTDNTDGVNDFSGNLDREWVTNDNDARFGKPVKNEISKLFGEEGIDNIDVNDYILKPEENDLALSDLILDEKTREKINSLLLLIRNKRELINKGGKLPKGYLLRGKPGLGKTSIQKALALEISDSDNIVIFKLERNDYTSKYVGDGEKKIKNILYSIKQFGEENGKHIIIFFDEFDDIGSQRKMTHEVHRAELNVLLRFLDGLGNNGKNVTFIASTNIELKELDEAMISRIDDVIELKMPGKEEIKSFLEKRFNSNFFSSDILCSEVYESVIGLSFRDLDKIIFDLVNYIFLLNKIKNLNDKIDKSEILKKIIEYKKNKEINRNKIGFY